MFLEVVLLGHKTNAKMLLVIIKFPSKVVLTFCISITNIGECFIHFHPQRVLPNFWMLANTICEKWDLRVFLICNFLLWAKQNIFPYFSEHLYFCSLWATWIFFFSFFYSTGTFGFRFNRVNGLPLSIVQITFFSVCHFPFFSGEFINLLIFSIILFINCVLIWAVFSILDFLVKPTTYVLF